EFGEVAIARAVSYQQRQGKRSLRVVVVLDEDVAATHRLDATGNGGAVEFDEPEHVHVIGDRHGGHAQFRRAGNQLVDAHQPVHDGVFGMESQMDEACVHWQVSTARDTFEDTADDTAEDTSGASRACTGLKLRRWMSQGPRLCSACRCTEVGYPLWEAKP